MTKRKKIILILAGVIFLFILNSPVNFPEGEIVSIKPGTSLREASSLLKEKNVIRSRILFEALVVIFDSERHVAYADYFFENKIPVFAVARRVSKGEHHLPQVKVTIPEGFNTKEISETFDGKLSSFDETKFLTSVKGEEGHLFPDTYFFFPTDNEEDVVSALRENFKEKIESVRPQILKSGKSEKNIIIMASLIEGEAKGDDDREVISGILWKRFSIGMPLQVDVALETYKVAGLPKNPIGNPGLEAIKAAITPKNSPYLYYLHDKDGKIHYARNFEEHKINKSKYLP